MPPKGSTHFTQHSENQRDAEHRCGARETKKGETSPDGGRERQRLAQTEDRVAEVDDAVAMGDEDHRVVRKLGGEAFQESGLGLSIQSGAELIQKEDAAGAKEGTRDGYALGLTLGQTCT